MKILVTEEFEFDEVKERARIMRAFRGSVRDRQINILDAFIAGEFERVAELYNALPYNKHNRCPEQEFTHYQLMDFVVGVVARGNTIQFQ